MAALARCFLRLTAHLTKDVGARLESSLVLIMCSPFVFLMVSFGRNPTGDVQLQIGARIYAGRWLERGVADTPPIVLVRGCLDRITALTRGSKLSWNCLFGGRKIS